MKNVDFNLRFGNKIGIFVEFANNFAFLLKFLVRLNDFSTELTVNCKKINIMYYKM